MQGRELKARVVAKLFVEIVLGTNPRSGSVAILTWKKYEVFAPSG